ncbi:MAG: hypothetical protein US86_C0007G0008 [Candidatus Daviesbacteria bacterium GW2011_GWA2_38_24]|uniref:Uncharacterized protein n=1 Tax=Candidatus Daviesbacteria bacterium GW2011_GWA2_38_24 TaxID=1618422 RepID=A0A0G0JE67_9BACT|nr:MAG: hypothetical protein US86_C0007G0008 [Candidatus Daviesbacteria bacterium GW2011_GWA2_38_24]KKQ80853.1 MAG: hypothetical protein UT01_C0005G0008 [Candidatus Daviesbacteria bacterium GW2011_GWA1_38_7]
MAKDKKQDKGKGEKYAQDVRKQGGKAWEETKKTWEKTKKKTKKALGLD